MASLRNLAIGILRAPATATSPLRCAATPATPPDPWRFSASPAHDCDIPARCRGLMVLAAEASLALVAAVL